VWHAERVSRQNLSLSFITIIDINNKMQELFRKKTIDFMNIIRFFAIQEFPEIYARDRIKPDKSECLITSIKAVPLFGRNIRVKQNNKIFC
jgi:hypothetical protein